MTAADLDRYRLKPVARVHISGQTFVIDITDPEAVKHKKCIYAFLIGGKVVRVGSSKAPLDSRLKNYERHITHALKDEKSPTPASEAKKWREILPAGREGVIYARPGTKVKTPIGEFPAYLDEESVLIGKLFDEQPHDHVINRNKHR